MDLKKCRRCEETRPLSQFDKNKQAKDGLNNFCKPCRNKAYLKRREDPAFVQQCRAATKSYDEKNPEKVKAHRRGWMLKNAEKRVAQGLPAYPRNPETANAACRAWRARNPEAVAATSARWYAENREKKLAADKARREKHLEVFIERERASYYKFQDRHKARAKAYRERNPHRVTKAASLRRAALINRTPGWLTAEDYAAMDNAYLVAQVFRDSEGRAYHVDHILPLRGRYVSGLHVPSNLQLLPPTENLRKSNLWEV